MRLEADAEINETEWREEDRRREKPREREREESGA